MSIVCLSWVMKHSEAKLGARLTLFSLAEFAHDDGSKAFPAIETLMERTRLSRSGVKSALKSLRDAGSIVETGTTRAGVVVYRVVMEGGSESDRGQNLTEGGSESGPNPLGEPSSSSKGGQLPKIAGRKVDRALWETTVAVLAEFNSQTGKRLAAVTGGGAASESAKRIYGRVKDWPALTVEEHAGIIRRTLASKWWGDGAPSIGVVFGPRVFEDNMGREEQPAGSKGGKPSFERKKGSVEDEEL